MIELKAMKAVYCYYFPEIRGILRNICNTLPDSMFLVSTPAHEVNKTLEGLFDPPLLVTTTATGCIDLDEIHQPIIDRILKVYEPVVPGLNEFGYRYPTAGSNEGIFHILVNCLEQNIRKINVLEGDYEGYAAHARNIGIDVNIINPDIQNIASLEPGYWFISNPSARDGNIIDYQFLQQLCESGHKLVIDLAYVGATQLHQFDCHHHNIIAVVMSMSKPYGVFRFRLGGFTFSRYEIPTLYGNKWFKDIVRLFQALKIAETIGPNYMYKRYSSVQGKIINEINHTCGLAIKASDSFLLAYLREKDALDLTKTQMQLIEPFKRARDYRFCLTPYFEEHEKKNG